MSSRTYDDGAFQTKRYCIRCALAIQASLEHKPTKAVNDGDLRWSRLSAKFRKAWILMAEEFHAAKTDAEINEAKMRFIHTIGIKGLNANTMSAVDAVKRKQWKQFRIAEHYKSEAERERKSRFELIEKSKLLRRKLIALRTSEEMKCETDDLMQILKTMIGDE